MGTADANCATIGRVLPVKRFNPDFKSECPSAHVPREVTRDAVRQTLGRLLAQRGKLLARRGVTGAESENLLGDLTGIVRPEAQTAIRCKPSTISNLCHEHTDYLIDRLDGRCRILVLRGRDGIDQALVRLIKCGIRLEVIGPELRRLTNVHNVFNNGTRTHNNPLARDCPPHRRDYSVPIPGRTSS